MEYFGVKLHSPQTHFGRCLEGSETNIVGRGDSGETFGNGSDGVAMAHPYLCSRFNSFEEGAGGVYLSKVGASVFARRRRFYFSAEFLSRELSSVAYAEYRKAADEFVKVEFESAFVVYRQRAARQDDTDNAFLGFAAERELVVGDNFAVDRQFADAAANQLSGLRTEVEDYYFLRHKKYVFCCAKILKNRDISCIDRPRMTIKCIAKCQNGINRQKFE